MAPSWRIWWRAPCRWRRALPLQADENLRPELRARLSEKLEAWLAAHISERARRARSVESARRMRRPERARSPARRCARPRLSALRTFRLARSRRRATMPDDERAAMRGLQRVRRAVRAALDLHAETAAAGSGGAAGAAVGRAPEARSHSAAAAAGPDLIRETTAICRHGFLAAAGFRVIGPRAIRLDMLDRLEEELEKAAAAGHRRRCGDCPSWSRCWAATRRDARSRAGGAGLDARGGDRRRCPGGVAPRAGEAGTASSGPAPQSEAHEATRKTRPSADRSPRRSKKRRPIPIRPSPGSRRLLAAD